MLCGCDVDVVVAAVVVAVDVAAVAVAAVAVAAVAVVAADVALGGSNLRRVGSEDQAVAVGESNQQCTLGPSTITKLEA